MSEAVASLPVEHVDDTKMVTLIKGVGAPPPLSLNLSGQKSIGQEHKEWVIRFLGQLYSPKLAAEILGVASSTLYHHKRNDPAFRAAWEQAQQDSHEMVFGLAMEEAHGVGVRHHITKDGDIIEVPKDRNDKIITAFLNFSLGTRHIHEGLPEGSEPGSLILTVTPSQLARLSAEEQDQLTLLLAKLDSLAPKTIEHEQVSIYDEANET